MSFDLLSKIHQYLRGAGRGTIREEMLPETSRDKEYPRMPRIKLPIPQPLTLSLGDALHTRISERRFIESGAIDLDRIATLLGHALGTHGNWKRLYPSGGGLFPIETYLINRTITGIPTGIFHYLPRLHALEHLWDIPADSRLFKNSKWAAWAETGTAVLVFTGLWEKSQRTYGDFSYILGLLEAGHMAQNVMLAATALGIGSCPLGGFNDESVTRLLGLDGVREQPVYTVVLSKPREQAAKS